MGSAPIWKKYTSEAVIPIFSLLSIVSPPVFFSCLIFLANIASGQSFDSLLQKLQETQEDTNKVEILNQLCGNANADDINKYAHQALELSEKLGYKKGIADAILQIGYYYKTEGNIPLALTFCDSSLSFSETIGYQQGVANAYGDIGSIHRHTGDYGKALDYYKMALKIRKEQGDKQRLALSMSNIALVLRDRGELIEAWEYYQKSLILYREINDQPGIASIIHNMAIINFRRGDVIHALENHYASLKIWEELKDNRGIALSFTNLGDIYLQQGDTTRALENYYRCLDLWQKIGDSKGIAKSMMVIGSILIETSRNAHLSENDRKNLLKNATIYLNTGLKIVEEINYKPLISAYYSNLGKLYEIQNDFQKALDNYRKGLAAIERLTNAGNSTNLNWDMGVIFLKQNRMDSALLYGNRALYFAYKTEGVDDIQKSSKLMSDIYENIANSAPVHKKTEYYKKALHYHKIFKQMTDSLLNAQTQTKTAQQILKYEFDKKETIVKAEQEKQNLAHSEENKRQTLVIYFVAASLFIALVFSYFLFKRFRITSRQKKIIEVQKSIVDVKNREITDSINYAQHIQSAILPDPDNIKDLFSQSFILFKPKDIVSGDFYFFTSVNRHKLVSVADGTGHGVPGSFMSLIGNNLLNEIVIDKSITASSIVLDNLHSKLMQMLTRGNLQENMRDGMDIAFCSLEYPDNKDADSKVKLQYAGAFNPLWIIRKDGKEIDEINADRQPIGSFSHHKPFTNHIIELSHGDSFYLFSDGFTDQIGGAMGKKFKNKQFRNTLLSIQNRSMDDQKQILESTIDAWKKEEEQTDDICVMGVRI